MSIITALGQAFKTQTGESMQHDKIATLLLANMSQLSELAKQGKLNQSQILQVRTRSLSCHAHVIGYAADCSRSALCSAEGVCGQEQIGRGPNCTSAAADRWSFEGIKSFLAGLESYFIRLF